MHPWMIENLAEQHVADLRRHRRDKPGASRMSVWIGSRLIDAGCRLARPGARSAARGGA